MSKFYLSYKFNNETISFLQAKDILNNSIKAFIHSLKSMRMYVYASKGIIFREKSRVTLEDIFIPYPKKSEVIVETIKTVVSTGTEIAQLNNLPNALVNFPYQTGYCGSGIIKESGKLSNFKKNDRVCGLISHSKLVILPNENIFKIPDDISFKDAAFFPLFVIAKRSIDKIHKVSDKKVAIFGQGLIAQILIQLIKSLNPKKIYSISRSGKNDKIFFHYGADQCISLNDKNSEYSNIDYDLAFDVTPDPETVKLCLEKINKNGRIILLGSARGNTKHFDFQKCFQKEIVIEGAHARLGKIDLDEKNKLAGNYFELIRSKKLILNYEDSKILDPYNVVECYSNLSKNNVQYSSMIIDWSKYKNFKKKNIFSLLNIKINGLNIYNPREISIEYFKENNDNEKEKNYSTLNKKISYALIGCGEIGLSNAKAIQSSKNSNLIAVADNDINLAKDISKKYECEYTDNYKNFFLNKNIDVVFISTPHHLHMPIANEALANKKHVIVEKPLSNNISNIDKFYSNLKKTEQKATIAFLYRFDPKINFYRKLIKDGNLGKIVKLDFSLILNKPKSYWMSGNLGRSNSDWRKDKTKSGGGIVIMQLSHHFDIIRYITGLEFLDVKCHNYFSDNDSIETSSNIIFKLSNGSLGNINTTYNSTSHEENSFKIYGSHGYVDVNNSIFYSSKKIKNLYQNQFYKVTNFPKISLRSKLIDDFSNSIILNNKCNISIEDGIESQKIIEKCYLGNR
ncbi:Gfo/Idh/MocA family oxidoreductase [Candidatus Pelagibacter communis]|uniref:Gfo/Idh/MocA family oxidoreductase n=1 Tax=Pelagibacter ubique TaxID=198252 RepID=UPI00094D9371|nr:Gfo/Idh/MocA family oxidoreductase [Candidatus Pelagibacter ubique]